MNTSNTKNVCTIIILSLTFLSVTSAKIIYVDADANGLNDGTSWVNAYKFLQDALADANDSPKPVEIRVAQGIYKPDQGGNKTPGDRTASFQLKNEVALKGGYAGFGEIGPNARDIDLYETILSGDLDGNDVNVNDLADLLDEPTRSENSYHVVTGSGTDATAVLDRFTITGGNANGANYPRDSKGGGMYNWTDIIDDNVRQPRSSPTLVNCTFRWNLAKYGGGGMYNYESSPTLTNCTFSENAVTEVEEGWDGGGGMYNIGGKPILIGCTFKLNLGRSWGGGACNIASETIFTDCIFEGNWATLGGGAVDNCAYWDRSPTFENCTFIGNWASSFGGGMSDAGCKSKLTNCTFYKNWAVEGGGLWSEESSPILSNCIFSGNSAEWGGGTFICDISKPVVNNCTFTGNCASYAGGGLCSAGDSCSTLANCILWDNRALLGLQLALAGGSINPSTIIISYSDVQGGREEVFIMLYCTLIWSDGNIDADPYFAKSGYWDPNGTPANLNDDFWIGGDYHLKSQGGRWDPNSQSWVKDNVTSPCIDAGDPASPVGLEPFPNGGIINMGAYGGTEEASKSYFGKPVCETIVAGDINGDCIIDFKDFTLMALHWLECIGPNQGGLRLVEDDTEDSYSCEGNFDVFYPCSNAVDEDWDTYALPADPGATSYICETYIIPSGIEVADFRIKYQQTAPVTPGLCTTVTDYWDGSTWTELNCTALSRQISTLTVRIPHDALSRTTLQLRTRVWKSSGLIGSGSGMYYEGKVIWYFLPVCETIVAGDINGD
jgi:hypothetical protein